MAALKGAAFFYELAALKGAAFFAHVTFAAVSDQRYGLAAFLFSIARTARATA